MAYCQMPNSTALVRDTWQLALLAEEEEGEMPSWKIIPTSLLGLVDWACVGVNPFTRDRSRQLCVLHMPAKDAEFDRAAYFPVEAHLYGFLTDHNVVPTGNWSGKPEDAYKAIQYICLHGGDYLAEFEAQKATLSEMFVLIERYIAPRHAQNKRARDEDTLFLQRHPFSKVTDASAEDQASVLTVADDPFGQAEEVEKQWRVMEKVKFEIRQDDGTTAPYSSLLLNRGDFVDVTVTFDIAYSRRNSDNMPVADVYIGFNRVVVLCPAKDVGTRMQTALSSGSPADENAEQEGMAQGTAKRSHPHAMQS